MQKTIFVVDDNGTNLSMAEEALEDEFRVITISSAEKMFSILEKVVPDLILLDIEMPEMDGFEALKRLKASDVHSKIPVIFMTATADAANEAGGKELGAADFITKPFSGPVLLDSINKHLISAT
ncbi:MAG: response regulator [Treponema sp.]|nr:response regulator [Treponema sp.]